MTCNTKGKGQLDRIVAVDPGMARCGLAISDPLKLFALPWKTLVSSRDQKRVAADIFCSFENEPISTVVFGIPFHLSGKKSAITLWAETLFLELEQLATTQNIHLISWDERLSSKQAEVLLREAGVKWQRRKQVQDSVAASLILQSYLDMRSYQLSPMVSIDNEKIC